MTTSKAVIDVSSINSSADLKAALTFAGVDIDDAASASLLAVFRSTDAPHADGETASSREVGIWTGSRSDRNHNPFQRRIRHVLGASPRLDPELVRSTVDHLETGAFITVEELLATGARVDRHQARSSTDKNVLATLLEAFCIERSIPHHVIDSLVQALDELYTNAVYNAPFAGKRGIDRSVQVVSDRPVTVAYGADERLVAVSVHDEYGSLSADAAIAHLSRCYSESMAKVQDKEGGAGIGLFMLLQNATRMVIDISPGVFTEVVVVRDFTLSRRDFARTAPTLNICGG